MKFCSVDGCTRRYNGKGYCAMHALRVQRHGDPHYVGAWQLASSPVCTVEGCDAKHMAKGYCYRHWQQSRKGALLPETLTCKRCASDFARPFKSRAKFCSAECRYEQQLENARMDPEKRLENMRKWRAKNPLAVTAMSQKRTAAKKNSESRTVTDNDLRALIARHGGKCGYCKDADYDHIDHIVPLSRGGRHAIGNLMPACAFCNLSKHARMLSEWRYGRGAERVAI
jgi:5-methylcytosine-specific restriction endonuclease McrA